MLKFFVTEFCTKWYLCHGYVASRFVISIFGHRDLSIPLLQHTQSRSTYRFNQHNLMFHTLFDRITLQVTSTFIYGTEFTIWAATSQPSCKVVMILQGYEHLAQECHNFVTLQCCCNLEIFIWAQQK